MHATVSGGVLPLQKSQWLASSNFCYGWLNANGFDANGLPSNGCGYTYRITDANNCILSDFFQSISACPAPRFGENEAKQINAYPNPFTNLLNIDVQTDEDLTIIVRDVAGRIVDTYKNINQSFVIDNQWDAGIYTISITNQNGSYNKMLKVIRTN